MGSNRDMQTTVGSRERYFDDRMMMRRKGGLNEI